MRTLFYFLVGDVIIVATVVVIQGEAVVVVIKTQVIVEDLFNVTTVVDRIKQLIIIGRSTENQNGLKI